MKVYNIVKTTSERGHCEKVNTTETIPITFQSIEDAKEELENINSKINGDEDYSSKIYWNDNRESFCYIMYSLGSGTKSYVWVQYLIVEQD